MKTKLEQLTKTLSQLGLRDPARYAQSLNYLIKISSNSFLQEAKILHSLGDIVDYLANNNIEFDDIVDENLSLPSFTLSVKGKITSKQAESLVGYTKFQIFQGLENYLNTFIKYYLQPKASQLYYELRDPYIATIKDLEQVRDNIQIINRSLRGVSKETVKSSLSNFNVQTKNATDYLNIVKRDLSRIGHGDIQLASWSSIPSNIQATLPKQEKPPTWNDLFVFDWEDLARKELARIEANFMAEKDLTPNQLFQVIKSFRPGFLRRVANTNSDDPNNKKQQPTDHDEVEFDEAEFEEAHDDQTTGSSKSNNQSKSNKDETTTNSKPNDSSQEKSEMGAAFRIFQEQGKYQDFESARRNYKDLETMVGLILRTKSLFSSGSSDTGISGEKLLRGFTEVILDRYQKAYETLLEHAYDSYITLYHSSQEVESSLPRSLHSVANAFENLGDNNI